MQSRGVQMERGRAAHTRARGTHIVACIAVRSLTLQEQPDALSAAENSRLSPSLYSLTLSWYDLCGVIIRPLQPHCILHIT